jgi:hypothetical protein
MLPHMPRFAARIHVLLATDAPLGVVIRRGPAKQVCTVLWDRKTDEFRVGQWLKGRIYERRSDISPPLPHDWILRKIAHAEPPSVGNGCYWDEHELLHTAPGERFRHPGWEWADVDRERLVWAEGGKLFAAPIESNGMDDEKPLFDFNAMSFEQIEAPY